MKKIEQISLAIKKMYIKMIEQDKKLLIMTIIYMFSFTFFDVIVAFFPKVLLDLYMNNKSFQEICIFITFFLVVGCLMGGINSIIREAATAKIGYLRIEYLADAFNKIITCDYKNMEDATFFNRYDSAFDACSNAENGIEKVYNVLFDLPALILKVVLFSCVMGRFSPLLLLAVLLHVTVSFGVKKKTASYKYMYKEEFSRVNRKKRYFNNITQDFQYGKDIRLYNLKNLLKKKYYGEIRKYKLLFRKVRNKEFVLNLLCCVTIMISDIAIYGVLIYNSLNGILISNITMYFIVVNMLISSSNLMVAGISDIYGEGLYISDYFDFIKAELCNSNGKQVNFSNKSSIGIQIRNLSFKYPNTEKYIFKNLNLSIMPGEKVALVGDNGVGKSTLIKIIVGLFRDFDGEVLIGGENIREISTENLFALFSIAFQDVNLLAYTVNENITGTSEISDSNKVWEALEKAGLKKKIEKNPKGLEQQVHKYIYEDGVEFSGGESQKMAIARAIFKDAFIFILDEPTASLDALAEKEIYEKFGNITCEKTTIFISHRLASTKFCDRIILIGADGVLEQGTHKELMELKGKYFEMFTLQGKYYQENKNEEDKAIC